MKVIDIEGVGEVFAEKLSKIGINSVDDLLNKASYPKDRQSIASSTGIPISKILEWANRADLYRIKGVGSEYSDLLEASGVDTVPELAMRKAQNLHQQMTEVNQQKKIVRQMPNEYQVSDWIDQAKKLPRILHY